MMITRQQLLKRRDYLCSSDLLQIAKKNYYKVWCSKVYKLKDSEPTEPMKMGILFEPLTIKWVTQKLGLKVDTCRKRLEYISSEHPFIMAHVDANVLNYPTTVEAKYSHIDGYWGYSGSNSKDDIPFEIYVQTQGHLICTEYEYEIVAVALSTKFGVDMRYYRIYRYENEIKSLLRIGYFFWEKYVLPAKESDNPEQFAPPIRSEENLNVFNDIIHRPEKVNPISEDVYFEWFDAKRHKKEADFREKLAKQNLMKQIGDAKAGKLSDGRILEYRTEHGRKNVDFDKMEQKYPEAYDELVEQGTRNVIREVITK